MTETDIRNNTQPTVNTNHVYVTIANGKKFGRGVKFCRSVGGTFHKAIKAWELDPKAYHRGEWTFDYHGLTELAHADVEAMFRRMAS